MTSLLQRAVKHVTQNNWREFIIDPQDVDVFEIDDPALWPDHFLNFEPYSYREKLRRFSRLWLAQVGLL